MACRWHAPLVEHAREMAPILRKFAEEKPTQDQWVGGIKDQIEDGVHGLLIEDPRDLGALAASFRRLFERPSLARSLGEAARERVRESFLGLDHLFRYAELIESLVGGEPER